MAWPPTQNIQVFDERALAENIFDWLQLQQLDALDWANNSAPTALDDIRAFQSSARLTTVFPALTLLQSEHSSAWGNGEILIIVPKLVFELALSHGDQDVLSSNAKKYVMALESMLANLPETTFALNSIIPITSTIQAMETVYDVQGKIKSKFIQVSQTTVSWVVEAAMHSN
jgi:hypothetical protein